MSTTPNALEAQGRDLAMRPLNERTIPSSVSNDTVSETARHLQHHSVQSPPRSRARSGYDDVERHGGGHGDHGDGGDHHGVDHDWLCSNTELFFDLVYVVIIHVVTSPLENTQ